MNLVQIQERLKEMPINAVMAYANGQNPQVPPYIALGELNRRKQMEQSAQKAQPAQGTVKDQIEQQAGLMALQNMRQQQAAQSSAQQSAQMPTIPEGTPQPAMQEPQEAGVSQLPTGPMNFGSGGIVSFANNPDQPVEEGMRSDEERESEMMRAIKTPYRAARQAISSGIDSLLNPKGVTAMPMGVADENLSGEIMNVAGAPAAQPSSAPADNQKRVGGMTITEAIDAARRRLEAEGRQLTPEDLQIISRRFAGATPDQAPPQKKQQQVQPRVAQANPPQAQPPVAPQEQGIYAAAMKKAMERPEAAYPNFAAARQKAEATDPYLRKQPGEVTEQYLKQMEERDAEDRRKFEESQKARGREALWSSLISAGEATRGRSGIGALLGGYGRASLQASEAERGREEQQRAAERERMANRVKMQQEIESARIARAEGRFKDAQDHEAKAAKFAQDERKGREDLIRTGYTQESADVRDRAMAELRFKYEKILKGIPQAQRATLEEQYVEDAVKAGMPRMDAIRQAKTLGVEARAGLTYDQASDNVDKFLSSTAGMSEVSRRQKEAKDAGKPIPSAFEIRQQLIADTIKSSAQPKADKKTSDLLSEADKIVAGVK